MFYRDYRPQKFSDLIGADHIVSALTSSLSKGNPSHAFFFVGSRGVGKTTIARLLSKAITCEIPVKNAEGPVYYEPCGKCKSCKAIENGNYLDLIEIDAASNRGIDNIRDLKDNVTLSPTTGKAKIYIIDEVHMLTTEASNALLKTLEEPPEHAYFILCTTNPEKVLLTIKSRCQQFQFRRPSIQDLVNKLRVIATDQKFDISDEKLRRISIVAKGAFREAETLLEQLINGDEYIDQILNEQESNYYEFLSFIVNGEQSDAIKYVHQIQASGTNIELWTENLVDYSRSLLLAKMGVTGIDDTYELNDLERALVVSTSLKQLKLIVERFSKSLGEFRSAVITTLPIELAIVDVSLILDPSIDSRVSSSSGSIPENQTNPATPSNPAENIQQPKNIKEAPPSTNLADSREASAPADSTVNTSKALEINMKAETDEKKPKETMEAVSEMSKSEAKAKPAKKVIFPYKKLVQSVKTSNHSIHLLLHSCKMKNYDGKHLDIEAGYSFHKERLLSTKIRNVVEETATKLIGNPVILRCELSANDSKAKSLTDRNIIASGESGDIEAVFTQVFGENLESSN